jgi:hypothetical protein
MGYHLYALHRGSSPSSRYAIIRRVSPQPLDLHQIKINQNRAKAVGVDHQSVQVQPRLPSRYSTEKELQNMLKLAQAEIVGRLRHQQKEVFKPSSYHHDTY